MKKQVWAAVLGLILAQAVHAGQVEKWQGSGQVSSPDGQVQAEYQVTTDLSFPAQNVKQSDSRLTFSDGSYKDVTMTITISGNKFSTKSSLGDGGGACYANDICESYIDAGQGHGYATTIIKDSATAQRHLTARMAIGDQPRTLKGRAGAAGAGARLVVRGSGSRFVVVVAGSW